MSHPGEHEALSQAEVGALAWRAVARLQRGAVPDHGEFYTLAGELVATLHALGALAATLHQQVSGYGTGRVVRDDQGGDPGGRLEEATRQLAHTRAGLAHAHWAASEFWSTIGHIGLADVEEPS